MNKLKTSWVDPRKFKNDEEYSFAMKVAWGFAQASQEIIDYVENSKNVIETLNKKDKGEVSKFSIGS